MYGAEIHVLAGKFVEPTDAERVFGPLEGRERILTYEIAPTFGVILRDLGYFKSRKEAKVNGHDFLLPSGYSEHQFGKHKRRKAMFYVWNPGYGLCPTCTRARDMSCECSWEGESCSCLAICCKGAA